MDYLLVKKAAKFTPFQEESKPDLRFMVNWTPCLVDLHSTIKNCVLV